MTAFARADGQGNVAAGEEDGAGKNWARRGCINAFECPHFFL